MCVSVCVCVFGFLIDKPLYKGETAVFGSRNRSIRGNFGFWIEKPLYKGETAVFGSGNRSIRGKLRFFDPKTAVYPLCVG